MRKTALLVLGLALSNVINAQDFSKQYLKWNVWDHTAEYTGVELVKPNGMTYNLILCYDKNNLITDSLWSRVDSATGNVYEWRLLSSIGAPIEIDTGVSANDLLIHKYDNVLVGDTMNVQPGMINFTKIVYSVDTVLYGGIQRTRVGISLYSTGRADEYWIEGIGSSFGPEFKNGGLGICPAPPVLLCYSEDSTVVYMDSAQLTCYAPWPINIVESQGVKLEVIVREGQLHVSFPEEIVIINSKLSDTRGREMSVQQTTSGSTEIVDLTTLPQGIYVYESNVNGKQYRVKVSVGWNL